jgi:hypothetical protein
MIPDRTPWWDPHVVAGEALVNVLTVKPVYLPTMAAPAVKELL